MAAFRVAARALTLERPHERYLSQRRRTGGHHSTLARRLKRAPGRPGPAVWRNVSPQSELAR